MPPCEALLNKIHNRDNVVSFAYMQISSINIVRWRNENIKFLFFEIKRFSAHSSFSVLFLTYIFPPLMICSIYGEISWFLVIFNQLRQVNAWLRKNEKVF